MRYFAILIVSLFLFAACSEQKESPDKLNSDAELPEDHPEIDGMGGQMGGMNPNASSLAYNDGRIFLSDFSMEIPEEWNMAQPSSSMRLVEFVPDNNKDLTIIGFYFGNHPTMVEENIERWELEFSDLESSITEELADGKITYVELTGTYRLKPFPMAENYEETPGFMTIACIIPSPVGPYFFKAFAPEEELSKEIPNFKKFINTYRIETEI